MADIAVSRVLKALLAKGFVRRDTHHIMLWFMPGGRHTSVVTRISHGTKTVDDWLLARIAHQLGLSKKELLALIECTLSEAEYLRLLVERGLVA
jgi:hypothetical protein